MKIFFLYLIKKIKLVLSILREWLYGMDSTEIVIKKRDNLTEKQHLKLVTHKGSKVYSEKGFKIFSGHHNIFLGSNIYLVDALINAGNDSGKVTIDDYVFFGHGVCLLARGHDYNFFNEERHSKIIEKPIHLKEGSWIGSRSIILGGVTVGKHSVVAAGSVVVKDVPDYAVVGGNPANVIKFIKNNN